MILAGPVDMGRVNRSSGDVFLVFAEADSNTYVSIMDRAEVLECGADGNVLAVYELNNAGQFRQCRVITEPFVVTGVWNQTMAVADARARQGRGMEAEVTPHRASRSCGCDRCQPVNVTNV